MSPTRIWPECLSGACWRTFTFHRVVPLASHSQKNEIEIRTNPSWFLIGNGNCVEWERQRWSHNMKTWRTGSRAPCIFNVGTPWGWVDMGAVAVTEGLLPHWISTGDSGTRAPHDPPATSDSKLSSLNVSESSVTIPDLPPLLTCTTLYISSPSPFSFTGLLTNFSLIAPHTAIPQSSKYGITLQPTGLTGTYKQYKRKRTKYIPL
jgi:hypothetical protein